MAYLPSTLEITGDETDVGMPDIGVDSGPGRQTISVSDEDLTPGLFRWTPAISKRAQELLREHSYIRTLQQITALADALEQHARDKGLAQRIEVITFDDSSPEVVIVQHVDATIDRAESYWDTLHDVVEGIVGSLSEPEREYFARYVPVLVRSMDD